MKAAAAQVYAYYRDERLEHGEAWANSTIYPQPNHGSFVYE
ncbi:MAG: hypothetical protein ONA69_00610 [candidate division KSB1 bacterium]|nr:hypothetical protein [candidate division KSB1 bacterium]